MQKVRVIADTVAGLPSELIEQYDIKVVPVGNIIYDGQWYLDGVSISPSEAYDLLRKDPDKFRTSAISPGYLLDVYRDLGTVSRDIVFIALSSAMSAVFKSASVAADMYMRESPDVRIRIVDSKIVSSGQGLVTLAAAKAASEGKDLDQVADAALNTRQRTGNLILLDTVRYVYRTGRMPKIASRIGSMLGVKPIARITDKGEMHSIGLCRTRESGIRRMIKEIGKQTKGAALHFMILHADAPEAAENLRRRVEQEFDCLSMVMGEFSPVMGYSAGPGSLTIGFHPAMTTGEQVFDGA
jgi:DegV family protein with EDD domain